MQFFHFLAEQLWAISLMIRNPECHFRVLTSLKINEKLMRKNNFDHLSKPQQNVAVTCFTMSYGSGSASEPAFSQNKQLNMMRKADKLNCFVLSRTIMRAFPPEAVIYIAAFQSQFVECQEAAGQLFCRCRAQESSSGSQEVGQIPWPPDSRKAEAAFLQADSVVLWSFLKAQLSLPPNPHSDCAGTKSLN